ncbi:hypothetical protein HBI62_053910 [Parastagonospora nodorum]|nr:hypothetical protein HBH49_015490 [Parastagonospora nodorum]KAH4820044.1 hypothetical protein HBH61_025920 [Parastagonospora nodorum]KAH5232678.1 hypothetical protein HBI62_053910 [Parastagonospora nodorum]KAH5268106.1 hypothetical protein HBI71_069960 [Parastagonospora nodorum]KAH6005255.1 hypothetical protein HBI84_068920 [Parastagonospora nodorum]
MDDDMPPLMCKLESPSIKVEYDCESLHEAPPASVPIKLEEGKIYECEIYEGDSNVRPRLVAYSSSPPLIENCPALYGFNEDATQLNNESKLHEQLELSTYEYDALDERYRGLLNQHRKLKQLATAYRDIIHGSASHEEPDIGLDQLHAEAGYKGLRAKALEVDVLRPVIEDAGGPEAASFLVQSVQALIEQVGSLEDIWQLVESTATIRRRLHELGGLQGLDQLVTDSKNLLAEQQALAKLERIIDGPNGLRAKAAKYDRLQQAFTSVEAGRDAKFPPTNVSGAMSTWKKKTRCASKKNSAADSATTKALPLNTIQKQYSTLPSLTGSTILSTELGVINAARARLLTSEPDHGDPDRDLYEPKEKPPVRSLSAKADNANNMPLGRSRTDRSSEDYDPDASRKRKHELNAQVIFTKRPRVDIGRASALVESTLAASSADPTNAFRPYTPPDLGRSPVSYSDKRNEAIRSTDDNDPEHRQRVRFIRDQVSELIESRGESKEAVDTTPARVDRSSVDSLLGSIGCVPRPTVKIEAPSDSLWATRSNIAPATGPSRELKTQVFIENCPIALWVGASHAGSYSSADLIKDNKIPYALAMFLFTEMKKYLNDTNAKIWATMTPNNNTCILRYLIDGHRPSGLPQESRACRMCSSAWVRHHRPCALLQDLHGIRTVVFMPLRDALRRGVAWTEKRFWIMDI